jgi:predicted transcriptional regulator
MNSALVRLLSLRVGDVMNRRVVQISQEATLQQVARTFCEKEISGAPVVDGEHRCVGILSANDFVRCFAAGNPESSDGGSLVSRQMTRSVRSIAAEEALLAAARRMCDEHIHRLPVLDSDGRVAGMVTSLDIVAALVQAVEE